MDNNEKENVEVKEEKIESKKTSKTLLTSVLVILVYLLMIRIMSLFLIKLNLINDDNYYLCSALIHVIICIVLLIISKKLNIFNLFKERGKGFFYTLGTAGFLVVFLLISMKDNFDLTVSDGYSFLPYWRVISFIADMLIGAGLAEELLFRGIIENLFIKDVKEFNKDEVWKIVFNSGFLFGLAHISNVFSGASLSGTLMQAIAAIAVGMYFGAIYIRGNNFLAMVFLHFLNDFTILYETGMLGRGLDIIETISDYSPIKFIGVFLYIGLTLFLLRKTKMDEIIEYRNSRINNDDKKIEKLESEN